ncbi:MAG: hypothetical protein H7A37_04980 [Chlamydiales bacterium]|nr:hypothetical protein [Chlamydiia bacterium]MCP5507636.1 hypothetical protein [Chlamydiales bacterium]
MIKKFSYLFITLITTQFCCMAAIDDQEISLRLTPTVGDSYKENYYAELNVKQNTEEDKGVTVAVDLASQMLVADIDSEGNITFAETINDLSVKSNLPQINNCPFLAVFIDAVKGKTMNLTMSPERQLMRIDGADEIAHEFLKNSGIAPVELANGVTNQINQFLLAHSDEFKIDTLTINVSEPVEKVITTPEGATASITTKCVSIDENYIDTLHTVVCNFDDGVQNIRLNGSIKHCLERKSMLPHRMDAELTLDISLPEQNNISVSCNIYYLSVKQ